MIILKEKREVSKKWRVHSKATSVHYIPMQIKLRIQLFIKKTMIITLKKNRRGYFFDMSGTDFRWTGLHQQQKETFVLNPLSKNRTKWSNTLKQFIGNS